MYNKKLFNSLQQQNQETYLAMSTNVTIVKESFNNSINEMLKVV